MGYQADIDRHLSLCVRAGVGYLFLFLVRAGVGYLFCFWLELVGLPFLSKEPPLK